jgi:methyl-accepting chemotaxis protein
MLSTLFNQMIGSDKKNALQAEVAEYYALKAQIDKARCVLEFDLNGTITSVNQNALAALGYSKQALTNQNYKVLIPASSDAYQGFWQNLENGETNNGSFELQNNAGDSVWFQGYFTPVVAGPEGLSKVVALLTDITNDKSATLGYESLDQGMNQVFGIMKLDVNDKILSFNEPLVNAFGYSEAELKGQSMAILLDAEDYQCADYKALWEQLRAGSAQVRQTRIFSKNKKQLWFQSSYIPVLGTGGVLDHVVVFNSSITAEKNKNADNAGQMAAIDNILGVIEFDLKGNVTNVNDNFAAVTGYSAEEIIGNHHSMFVETAYKNSAEYKAFWDKLNRGETDEGQYKRIGKGGKEVWLQASYSPILDMDGNAIRVVKYATDITAQRLAAADNAGQLAAIDKIQGVIEFDLKGNITKVNDNFAAVTGYSESEIVGNHHSMFVDAAYKNSTEYKAFWDQLGRGEANAGEFKRIAKGGKEVWLQARYSPILDTNGNAIRVVEYATDITEQHNAAATLQAAVKQSQEVIEEAKAGDLTIRVPMEGKTGPIAALCDGINALMDNMTEVLMTIREAGETINTAAGEISTGNNDLSQRTEQQASSLEETASSMEELASTVKQNAENAKQANQLASAASGVAVKGGVVVGNVVTTMSAINESAKKIEDIITVIDGIAFQTNILALNAAVEAARAGEQGRGFAVVAGEVRNLAQRSASAAKEIKGLIADSVGRTAEGTKQVEEAGRTMEEIVSSVQRVTDIMGEITAASAEQSAGIDQVNQAVASMDETTQQNAALVEEAAAAAESLVDQAATLMETVNNFNLIGGGKQQERRVTSSPMRRSSQPVSKAAPVKASAVKTGTDDSEWEEF